MSEAVVVAHTVLPLTRGSMRAGLQAAGLAPGHTVLVHSSLSALGWVVGGPVTVIGALTDALTPEGTLVMPTFTGEYSEPSRWRNPPVPAAWWPMIREHMPAFDPAVTPTRRMGVIAETFRTWPGVERSTHPQVSFAAWGRHARQLVHPHPLDYPLGAGSPLERLYDLGAQVLLLGVGYDRSSCFHLAESRAHYPECEEGAPVLEEGVRVWKRYRDVVARPELFPALGQALEATGVVATGQIGRAGYRWFALHTAVDFAVSWLARRGAVAGRTQGD